MKAIPPDVVPYQRTREFTESTTPSSLRERHVTKPGVWARIRVVEGTLRYRVLEPCAEESLLVAGQAGVVEPGIPHQVEPVGEVRFYVEFLRAPG